MILSDAEILALAKLRHVMRKGSPTFPEFLEWIADRLEMVHKEEPLVDFMHAIRRYVAEFKEIQGYLK